MLFDSRSRPHPMGKVLVVVVDDIHRKFCKKCIILAIQTSVVCINFSTALVLVLEIDTGEGSL